MKQMPRAGWLGAAAAVLMGALVAYSRWQLDRDLQRAERRREM